MPYNVFFMEFVHTSCLGIAAVMRVNRINYTLACEMTSPPYESFLRWARTPSHIDVVDMDIQTYEDGFLHNPDVRTIMDAKVYD